MQIFDILIFHFDFELFDFFDFFTMLRVIPSVLVAASFQLRSLPSYHKFMAIQTNFYLNIWIFLKPSTKKSVS